VEYEEFTKICLYPSEEHKIRFKTFKKTEFFNKIDLHLHEDLKNELKMLYTGITRAKLHLVLFDEKVDQRIAFEKVLEPFNLMEYLDSEKQIEEYVQIYKILNY